MAMFNLENKFKTFYGTHVVLPKVEKQQLYGKKNLNISRLKEGLKEYNEEHGTSYKLAEEPIIQGSVAMSTVIQNEMSHYDIDVAIVFEKDNIPSGTIATKNMIVNALKRKCKQFKIEPTAKTNCVRIEYSEGYHIDFAIYRRYKNENDVYQYEHCGSQWRERNPRSITKWFNDENKVKDYQLRDIVRLLKMFCKSRSFWINMPGGLIQSVLSVEKFQSYDRLDERFYYTINAIKNRLAIDKEVYNPTDSTKSLKLVSKDSIKMTNLYNRLNDKIAKLDILFNDTCTWNQAVEAWGDFFNHEYWYKLKEEDHQKVAKALRTFSESVTLFRESEEYYDYRDTEEFIEDMFPINLQYSMDLDCKVSRSGQPTKWLNTMLGKNEPLLSGYGLDFIAAVKIPQPYDVYWKVKNQGSVAKRDNNIRGEVLKTGKLTHYEVTSFQGNHFVECFIIKRGECVARKKISVLIT